MSSDSSLSAVTYTLISSDSDALSWGIPLMDAGEPQSHEIAPLSPDYVLSPEEPKHASLLPKYVPKSVYPEYLAPSNDDISIEYQPLPADASLTTLSPGYIADLDPEEDPKEDPEDGPKEDPTEYPADEGDEEEEEESSRDDVNDKDEEEASEEDDDEEEKEHLAPIDSSRVPIYDPFPSDEETEPFEIDESAPTLPSPRLRKARISIPSPPLPLLLPPLLLHAPSSPLLLPATDHRKDVPEADVPPQKRLCLTAPTPRFEVRESLAVAAARQPGLDVTHATDYSFVDTVDAILRSPMSREVSYGITDVWDDMVKDMEERALTTLEELSQRVTDLAATLARDTHEMYV
ncbi:hypothetical protein Tco_0046152 [Tanacetum coccineum]